MSVERLYLHNKLVYEGDDGLRDEPPHLSSLHEALFCTHCGEIWARWVRGGDSWSIKTRLCLLHGDGCIFEYRFCDLAVIFIGDLLRREFLRQTAFVPSLLDERKRK